MRYVPLVLVCLVVSACGGHDSPTAPSAPQPYSETLTGTVSAFGSVHHPLTIPRSGNMTVRLQWTDPAVDLDLFLSGVGCTSLYPKSACGLLAGSDAPAGTTTESIARTVTNAETYQIWVDNLHLTRPQNYTLTLTIQ